MKINKILLTIFIIPLVWVNCAKPGNPAQVKQQKSCIIDGNIYGVNSQVVNNVLVVYFNPNNGQALGKSQNNVASGQINYKITPSKNGIYLLRVFLNKSGYLFPVNTSPNQRLVRCTSGSQITNVDFAVQ